LCVQDAHVELIAVQKKKEEEEKRREEMVRVHPKC
jgi:hypothetical protein